MASATVKSNVSSVLISGKGVAQTPPDHRVVARRLLGREHIAQVVFVGPVLVAGPARERLESPGETGHLQGAGSGLMH
jgi:arylamine N-acetyltransferase